MPGLDCSHEQTTYNWRGAGDGLRRPEGRPDICGRAHETDRRSVVVVANDYAMEIVLSRRGGPLSLLGGKRPIATTRCDRRRATINSCASREALNSPGPHARIPPSLIRGYARMC